MYHKVGNFQGRKLSQHCRDKKFMESLEKTLADCLHHQLGVGVAVNFADRPKTLKFVKLFSLKNFCYIVVVNHAHTPPPPHTQTHTHTHTHQDPSRGKLGDRLLISHTAFLSANKVSALKKKEILSLVKGQKLSDSFLD